MRPSRHSRKQDQEHATLPVGERTPKPEDVTFDAAVDSITGAVKKFRDAIGGDDDDSTQSYMSTNEENPYSARMPVGAFCLRMAHQLWRDTRPRADDSEDDDCPICATDPVIMSPAETVVAVAGHLTVEDLGAVADKLKSMHAEAVAAGKAGPPE